MSEQAISCKTCCLGWVTPNNSAGLLFVKLTCGRTQERGVQPVSNGSMNWVVAGGTNGEVRTS